MYIYFENNIILFVLTYVVASVYFVASRLIKNKRLRRAANASIIFLIFPIFYIGDPFLFYQCWMLIVIYLLDMNISWLLTFMGIWSMCIVLSQIRSRSNRGRSKSSMWIREFGHAIYPLQRCSPMYSDNSLEEP